MIEQDSESFPALEHVVLIQDGTEWEQEIAQFWCDSGIDAHGPINDLINSPAIIAADEGYRDCQLALIKATAPGPCGFVVPRALWNEHRIPSVIVSKTDLREYLPLVLDAGVFAVLKYPLSTADLLSSLTLAWHRSRQLIECQCTIARLEESLASRRSVEMAKWRLVEARGLSEPEAHAVLQKEARSKRLKISEVAESMLKETRAAN